MKHTLMFAIIFFLYIQVGYTQDFTLSINGSPFIINSSNLKVVLPPTITSVSSMSISTASTSSNKRYFFCYGAVKEKFNGDGQVHPLDKDQYVVPDKGYSIYETTDGIALGNKVLQFDIIGQQANQKSGIQFPSETIEQFFDNQYGTNVVSTRYGLVLKNGNTKYKGNNYTHVFFDQYGNSIFSAIPPGIPERQYVIHIIYMAPEKKSTLMYSVNETSGGFNAVLNIQNADIRAQLTNSILKAAGTGNTTPSQVIQYIWYDQEMLLSTSTDDISFDINRILINPDTIYNFSKTKIGSYTIKMTTTYNISMDVGLINSHLENPTYQLQPSASDPTQNVVKKTNGGNRGIVTIMATFYTSPIVLIEKYLLKKNIPQYKVWGRNYLDDHSLFERIYPSVGIGFTDNALQNLFYGINWEIVRGGAVFIGGHYGQVNVFNAPVGFVYGESTITQADFNLRQNTAWRSDFSIGIKVDVKVVTSLFGNKGS